MKNTKYFDDYQSAYNYYGGNIVPSNEIALIGNGSYIFVSSDNAVSGNTQYYDANLTNDEIVDTMTYTAYNNGVTYGEAIGFETGYTAGTTYGEAIGYAQGYEGGYSYGYSYGYAEGEAAGGVSLTNEQIDSMAIGNFVSNVFSIINYTNGFDEVTDYDTASVDSESLKSAMLNIVNDNADEADIMYVQEYDGLSVIHKTTGFTLLDEGEDNDYDQGSLAWSGTVEAGHKIGFNLFLLATDPNTGDYETESSKIYFKQTDSQTNNYTYNMIDVNATSDVTFKFGVSTDPESGDAVVEFTYSITPQ